MYKGISRPALVLAFAAVLTSCGGERKAASELYTQSCSAIEQKNYTEALALLDTLNARYPKETQVRRDALRLRAAAMEGIALDSISVLEAELAQATLTLEEWKPRFRYVASNVGLEGYYLPKEVDERVLTESGIQARVSEKGFFYIVANVQGRRIGLKSIELVAGADRVSSAEISPARVVSVEGSETASFNPEDLEVLGPWLLSHPDLSQLILVGSKSTVKQKLTAKQAAALIDCYRYSCAVQSQYLATVRREKFERMLATARDQLANLPQPDSKN